MDKPPKKPCFLAGTLVHTTAGLKPIEEIAVGEEVWCYDEINQEITTQKVSEIFDNFAEKYVEVTTQNGNHFKATGQHLFYQKNSKTWIKAYQLKEGMHLYNAKTDTLEKITGITVVENRAKTYNLEVPVHHNYLIGNTGILTHNGPSFATTSTREYAFYYLQTGGALDNNQKVEYIGKTTRDLLVRLKEHLNEGKRAINKGIHPHKHWKFTEKPSIFYLNKFDKEYVRMTEFESAVVEKYFLEDARFQTGTPLRNGQNPISRAKFNQYKQFHKDLNPCIFFV